MKLSQWRPITERLLVLSFMDLKLKYQSGVLGFFWSFFKPLIQFFAYYVIFGIMLKVGKSVYYPFELFLGILTWAWFSESTILGMSSFINKKPIITQIAMNRLYPPLAAFFSPSMNYLLNMLVFFSAYLIFFQDDLFHQTAYMFLQGFAVFLQAILTMSIVIISMNILLAYLNARFRDIQAIWELVIMYGIFVTPIFYNLPISPEYQTLYFVLNPLALPLLLLKSVFFPVLLPHLNYWGYGLHYCMIAFLLILSLKLHQRFRLTIADFI